MGIFGALSTAVTGMRAQSYSLENISGNIANSQTVAYKREDTSFVDLIPDAIPSKQVAGSVLANSRATNTVQGDIQTASIGTYMAINGSGFFIVEKPTSFNGNQPTFSGTDLYSRRGDFTTDQYGYLVNGAGYYLKGIPVDPVTGNLTGSVPELLQFSTSFLAPEQTTTVQYQANLPAYPLTPNHNLSVADSELLVPSATKYATSDPRVGGTGVVIGSDVAQFLGDSISGGAITAYDATGTAVNINLRWAKTDSALSGGTDTWNLFYETDSAATGAAPAWQNVNQDYTFVNGALTSGQTSITLTGGITVNGVALGNPDLTIQHGAAGMSQFSDSNGTVQVSVLQQDGFPAGQLQSVAVNDKGRVVGTYSNSRTIELAEVTLASFNGPNNLKRLDGGAFAATIDSGNAIYGAAGRVIGSSLEGSNADVGDEFTKLIVTQQAYSANTRVITTANQMIQDLLNTLR
jgi:flagellar hook protein FlgE